MRQPLFFMEKENPLKVGIVGAGIISAAYLKTKFPQFKITCCSDIQQTQAELRAREFRIAAVSTETILTDPAIDIVLNLTTPQHHAEVTGAGVRARKHVYSEKPVAPTAAQGRALLRDADARGRKHGAVEDKVYLPGLQKLAALTRRGELGRIVCAEQVAAARFGFRQARRRERQEQSPIGFVHRANAFIEQWSGRFGVAIDEQGHSEECLAPFQQRSLA